MTATHHHNAVIRRAIEMLEGRLSPMEKPLPADYAEDQCLRDIRDMEPIRETVDDIFVMLCEAAVSESPDTYQPDTKATREVLRDAWTDATYEAREWAEAEAESNRSAA